MSNYAYKDKARTKIIYADECGAVNKPVDYYCKNKNCPAIVRIRALESPQKNPYFSLAEGSADHIGWCRNMNFNSNSRDFDPFGFDDRRFSLIINQLLTHKDRKRILKSTISSVSSGLTLTRPETIADLYQICKSLNNNEKFGSLERKYILCDTESNYYYTKGIIGYHLVECLYHSYNPDQRLIYFSYPIDSSLPNQHKLALHFSVKNQNIFKLVNKKVYNKPSIQPIIVAGNWKKHSNIFISQCASKKAIYMI